MIYCFLANGFEETEAVAPIDILRRAEKEVITVGVGGEFITSSHGLVIHADIIETDVILSDKIEMIVLPGGMPGTLNLDNSAIVHKTIDFCTGNNKYIAAICAAPSILGRKNLLENKNATCFPGYENMLFNAVLSDEKVVADGKIITAKAAGYSIEFGLKLVEILCGEKAAKKIAESMKC